MVDAAVAVHDGVVPYEMEADDVADCEGVELVDAVTDDVAVRVAVAVGLGVAVALAETGARATLMNP